MKTIFNIVLGLACVAETLNAQDAKAIFQTAEPWKQETDICADAVMVYGTVDKPNMTFEQRIESWRKRGYGIQFMTGVAWGDYQDYFLGKWDGVTDHLREGQREKMVQTSRILCCSNRKLYQIHERKADKAGDRFRHYRYLSGRT
mgnify:CR=1 FL=1